MFFFITNFSKPNFVPIHFILTLLNKSSTWTGNSPKRSINFNRKPSNSSSVNKNFEIFFHYIFAIFLHCFQDFRQQGLQVNLAMHLFARFCEGNCKLTRTKYRVSTKRAYLTRISSHLFCAPKESCAYGVSAPHRALLEQRRRYSTYTTPSGLNSS